MRISSANYIIHAAGQTRRTTPCGTTRAGSSGPESTGTRPPRIPGRRRRTGKIQAAPSTVELRGPHRIAAPVAAARVASRRNGTERNGTGAPRASPGTRSIGLYLPAGGGLSAIRGQSRNIPAWRYFLDIRDETGSPPVPGTRAARVRTIYIGGPLNLAATDRGILSNLRRDTSIWFLQGTRNLEFSYRNRTR